MPTIKPSGLNKKPSKEELDLILKTIKNEFLKCRQLKYTYAIHRNDLADRLKLTDCEIRIKFKY